MAVRPHLADHGPRRANAARLHALLVAGALRSARLGEIWGGVRLVLEPEL
jgi:hypothetical protein